jgi:phosphoserine phosphatase
MKAHGARTLLVSGGFTAFSGPVAERIGFDTHQANRLLEENGRLTGAVAEPILGRDAKVVALEAAAARLGLGTEDSIALGDGANDLGMLARAGMGVAMHAKPAVAAQCDLRINHGDLTAALYLQGYGQAEFAQ